MHNTKIIPVAIFLDIVHTWHYCTETKKGREGKGITDGTGYLYFVVVWAGA